MDDRRRAMAIVFGVVFLDLLGFGIIVPILPFYTRSFPGGTEFVIGLLAASYSAMQFLSAPTLGSLSDRYGRRPVIVLSLAGGAVAWALFVPASSRPRFSGLLQSWGRWFLPAACRPTLPRSRFSGESSSC